MGTLSRINYGDNINVLWSVTSSESDLKI